MQMFKLIIICLLFISTPCFSISEFGGEFSYSKQLFGDSKQNDVTSRTYSASYAIYFWTQTALELNYSQSEEILTQHPDTDTPDSWTVTEQKSKLLNDVYGIGLRQSLTGMSSRIRPMISAGYARQFEKHSNYITFTNQSTGEIVSGRIYSSKERTDSVFATFALKFYFTKHLSVHGSVKSIFPAFEFSKAEDYLKYMVGLSCIF